MFLCVVLNTQAVHLEAAKCSGFHVVENELFFFFFFFFFFLS